MPYTKEDCIKETKEHISQVRNFMMLFALELIKRAEMHDKSKLEDPELEIFTEYTPKLKDSTYGSDEYKSFLKEMQVALKHHYTNNSHHPEHYENGICGMDLADIVEMFCDWKAATLRHTDGDIIRSIELNKERFKYSDDIEQIFKNSVKLFEK